MAEAKKKDPYKEVEVFLRRAEDEISQSFTELSGTQESRKSSSKYLGPVARKKRFLAKRQRSRTVELSLPSLHREGEKKDSSGNIPRNLDELPSTAVSMDYLHKSGKNPPIPSVSSSSKNELGLSSRSISVRDLPTTPTSPYLLKSINRRTKSNRSASPEWKSQPRLDFSKPEAVNRWASEILAEIESLPASSSNLSSMSSISRSGPQVAVVQPMLAATRDLAESRRKLDEACSQLRNLSVENLDLRRGKPLEGEKWKKMERSDGRKTPTPGSSSEEDLDSTVTPTASPTRGRGAPSFILPPPPPVKPLAHSPDQRTKPPPPSRHHRKTPRKRRLDASTQESHSFHEENSNLRPPHPDRSVRRAVANILRQAEESIPSSSAPSSYLEHNNNKKKIVINPVVGQSKRQTQSSRSKSVQYDQEEESAVFGDAEDEGSSQELEEARDLLDACTQTSPFSLSRSSSFTWMSEGDLEEQAQLDRLVFPGIMNTHSAIPHPGPGPLTPSSPDSSDSDSDEEVTRTSNHIQVNVEHLVRVKPCSNNFPGGLTERGIHVSGLTPDDDSLMLSEASGLASSEEENSAAFPPSTPPRRPRPGSPSGTLSSLDSFRQETMIRREAGSLFSSQETWRSGENGGLTDKEVIKAAQDSAFDESLKLLLLYTTNEGKTLGPEGWKERSGCSYSSCVPLSSSNVSAFTPIRADAERRKPPSSARASFVQKERVTRTEKAPRVQLTGDGLHLVSRPTPLYGSSQHFPGDPGIQEVRRRVMLHSSRTGRPLNLQGNRNLEVVKSPMAESIYDNVPNLRKQLASQGLLRPTVDSWSLIPDEGPVVFSPGSDMSPTMPRDVSMASGILADSESSPVSPSRERFAILDSNDAVAAAAVGTPDSAKSLTSSEGSFSLAMAMKSSSKEYFLKGDGGVMNGGDCGVDGDSVFLSRSKEEEDDIYDYPPESPRDPPPPSPKPSRLSGDREKSLAANSLPALDRTGSYDILDSMTSSLSPGRDLSSNVTSQASDSGFSSSKEKAEVEASGCCKWLRAAGFPQYAQMYEDHKFPIDVKSVAKDHEFLDGSDLQALFRRLHTLNGCAIMKLDSNVLMRKTFQMEEDSDDEDRVALSRKWRYQRKSKTWSRIVNDFVTTLNDKTQMGTDSSTSPNLQTLDLTAPPTGESLDSLNLDTNLDVRPNGAAAKMTDSVHVMVAEQAQRMNTQRQRSHPGSKTTEDVLPVRRGGVKLQRSQSERIKDKARAFMRRMGPVGGSRRRKTSRDPLRNRDEIVIGSPVLVSHQSASPPSMRMFKGTPPLAQSSPAVPRVHDQNQEHRSTERLERRQGRVFLLSDSSMEFEKVDVSGSPIRYDEKDSFMDSNSNIDRIFAPKFLPNSNRDVKGYGSTFSPRKDGGMERGRQRLGGNGKSLEAEKTSSPRPGRSLGGVGRDGSDGSVPLILYNPGYGTQNSSPASQGVHGFSSRHSLESSPEFALKSGRREERNLRVRVDVEEEGGRVSLDSSESDSPKYWEAPERRDSGVGSSLSRSPSGPTRSRVRWHSFQRQHRAVMSPRSVVQMDSLSVPQMIVVRQLALLRLTSLMERYSRNTKTSGPSWNWGVQKLFRRMKTPEHKGLTDRAVFGVALHVVAQRTGQPLPQSILHAMRFLRQQAPDAVGLFRKSGVRSRIQSLKQRCEDSNELAVYEAQQTFDVADLLKQYFRELPEPLLTTKLSETFIGIHLEVPEDLRLEATQKAVLLLPDENREVLHSLLLFLWDVSRYSHSNQMTAQNLAVCFAPSLFQLSPRLAAMSPTRRHKTITGGLPNEKELRENQAAQACLTHMILDCKKLFLVPRGIQERCSVQGLNEEAEPAALKDLGHPNGSFLTHLETCIATLLKEHRERWKGWMTEGSLAGVEITSKKLTDTHPLKLWRCWADVEAPPREVLERVLRERDTWDEDVLKWRVVERLGQDSELFQYVQNDMPPHPTREFCLVRLWKRDLTSLRGGCVLVETSVTSPEAPMIGGVRAVCLAARYLIEPSGAGHSRITYVCRIDTKGRGKSWYNKVFGYICARQIAHLRDSFRQTAEGPETKV